MKMSDLIEKYHTGFRPVIAFTSKIGELETIFDGGMKARIKSISVHHDNIINITFDMTEFDEFNRVYEQPNYWDKNRTATLTAREAGHYPENGREGVYFVETDECEYYFSFVEEVTADDVRSVIHSKAVAIATKFEEYSSDCYRQLGF